MALIHSKEVDGVMCAYHRIGAVKFSPGGVCTVTLESYADAIDRGVSFSPKKSQFDVVAPYGDPIPSAYAAIAQVAGWAGAQPDDGQEMPQAPPAVPSGTATWDAETQQWADCNAGPDLAEAKATALTAIDACAGSARLRYITSVAGQSETYQMKAAQARAWTDAGCAGNPPSFIAAEAAALGVNAQLLAAEVLASAYFWGEVKGPQIEASRRKWKVLVSLATTSAQAASLAEQARTELDAL